MAAIAVGERENGGALIVVRIVLSSGFDSADHHPEPLTEPDLNLEAWQQANRYWADRVQSEMALWLSGRI
jgi:hypothetical protein